MTLDIQELKRYIFENGYVEQILEAIQCHSIRYHANIENDYWTCANYDGDNKCAIVIYNTEYLLVKNYTRNMVEAQRTTDLIDLVCFNMKYDFINALQFICNEVGISYYHDFNEDIPESLLLLDMLDDMCSNFSDEDDEIALKPINPNILDYYFPYVNDLFKKDNISYGTQKDFHIGYDYQTNRITIPIYSEIGDLVGVKGRLFKEYLDEDDIKYLYIIRCNKSRILYGLNKTLPYIKQMNFVFIVESEKAVLQLWTYGYRNCVATGGKTISKHQVDMLVRLGVVPIFCFDKDVSKEEIERIAEMFPEKYEVKYMFDEDNILMEKESPSDKPESWEHLVENNIYRIK